MLPERAVGWKTAFCCEDLNYLRFYNGGCLAGKQFSGTFQPFLELICPLKTRKYEAYGLKARISDLYIQRRTLAAEKQAKICNFYLFLHFIKNCQFRAKSLNHGLPPFDNHRVRVNTLMTFHSGRGITFMSFHDHSI